MAARRRPTRPMRCGRAGIARSLAPDRSHVTPLMPRLPPDAHAARPSVSRDSLLKELDVLAVHGTHRVISSEFSSPSARRRRQAWRQAPGVGLNSNSSLVKQRSAQIQPKSMHHLEHELSPGHASSMAAPAAACCAAASSQRVRMESKPGFPLLADKRSHQFGLKTASHLQRPAYCHFSLRTSSAHFGRPAAPFPDLRDPCTCLQAR